jgi:hypothetical protein
MPAGQPEPPQADCELQRLGWVVGQPAGQRRPQVVVLDLQGLGRVVDDPDGPLRVVRRGERQVPVAVGPDAGRPLAGVPQPLVGELPDGLQQAIARHPVRVVGLHQRLVDQAAQQVDDV